MFFWNIKFLLFLLLICCSTSCSHIAKLCSTPTYSIKNGEKIELTNFNKNSVIYIQETANDEYGIQKEVLNNIEKELENKNIQTTKYAENATHILGLNIINIGVDIDYETANLMKNTLAVNEIFPYYAFDNGNSPHVSNNFQLQAKEKQRYTRRMLPSVLYTMIGSTVGFTTGFLVAGSFSPIVIGLAGAIVVGGATFFTYNTFRKAGVVITYEITIKEKINQQIKHSIKALSKKSSNIADEVFYDYKDNWNTYSSKNVIIAIGSRALNEYMISKTIPMITTSILRHFTYK